MADDSGVLEAPEGVAEADATGLRDEILQQLEAQESPDTSTESQTPQATYTLKDGTEVPISELEGGYLRQSDYTRKTQELAQQRAEAEQAIRLMQALAENPVETLEALQRNLGVTDTDENVDPLEQQLLQHEERFAQLEQERFDQELHQTLTVLEDQYAERGFDRDEVLQWAVDHEIPNLRAAFLDWEESKATDAARQQRNQEALSRKQSLPPLGGRSRQLGGDAPEFVEVRNMADAMKNALIELNLQS